MKNKKRLRPILVAALAALFAFAPVAWRDARALSVETIANLETTYTLASDCGVSVAQTATFSFTEETDRASILITGFTTEPDEITVKSGSRVFTDRDSDSYIGSETTFSYRASYDATGLTVTCYFPDRSDDITITFGYSLNSALTLYSDTALLNVVLVGDTTHETAAASATVVLPQQADPNLIDLFWSHYGTQVSSQTDGSTVSISLPEIPDGQMSVQVALPTSLFTDAPEGAVRQSEVLPDLQKSRNDSLTYIRRTEWFSVNGGRIMRLSVVAAVLIGLLTRIRRRRHRPMSVRPSDAALPIGLSALEFGQIMHFYGRFGKLHELRNALCGTLMRLADGGLLAVEAVEGDPNNFKLIYTPYEACETFPDENILLLLLFEDIAKGASEVTFKQIKKYANVLPGVVSGALRHMQEYAVTELSTQRDIEFFQFVKIPVDKLFQLVYILAAVALAYFQQWMPALVVLCGVFVIYLFGRDRLHRLSRGGEDKMARGKAFRRYVIQCVDGTQEGDLPPLSYWRGVMGYAAAIGLAPYVQRALPRLYPELSQETFRQDNAEVLPIYGEAVPDGGAVSGSLKKLGRKLAGTLSIVSRNSVEK